MTTPLQKAARELILRWDSPYWKDQPGTAHFMGELRKALDAAPPQVLEPGPTTRPLTPEDAEMMQSLGVTGKCVRVLALNDRPKPEVGGRAELIAGLRIGWTVKDDSEFDRLDTLCRDAADMLEADGAFQCVKTVTAEVSQ